MINASSEFRQLLYNGGNKVYKAKATVTLADGTVLNIANDDILTGGVAIQDAVSSSGFDIGVAACNGLTFKISNADGKYNDYDFYNATISLYIGLQLTDHVEWLNKGVYNVDLPQNCGSFITMTCMDNMVLLDKPITTTLNGTTAGTIAYELCTACGITLENTQFDGYSMALTLPADYQQYTYRQLLGWVAQCTCNFARCNAIGQIAIKWYNTNAFGDTIHGGDFTETESVVYDQPEDTIHGGDFTSYSQDIIQGGTLADLGNYHVLSKLKSRPEISTDEVVITGIKVVADDDNSYQCGNDGYVLEISGNPFVTNDNVQAIATYIASKAVGMRFRICNASLVSDPLVEAGDSAYVVYNNVPYQIYINSINYVIASGMTVQCNAKTPQHNTASHNSITEAVIQSNRYAKKEVTKRDAYMELMNGLVANAMGAYTTVEDAEGGGKIMYQHDQPTLAESSKIWKKTADGFFVSDDGGQTWNSGWDSSGNVAMNILSVIGINAAWMYIENFLQVGDYLKLNADGSVECDRMTAKTGCKIANMTVTANSLTHDNGSPIDDFHIITQHNDQKYSPNEWSHTFENTMSGKKRTAKVSCGYGKAEMTIYNADNTENAGVNISYADDGIPEINIYTRNADGLQNGKVLVNGIPILNTISSATNTATSALNAAVDAAQAASVASNVAVNAQGLANRCWRNISMICDILGCEPLD